MVIIGTFLMHCSSVSGRDPLKLPGKKGACFTLRAEGNSGSYTENLPKIKALNVSWNYSWGSDLIKDQPANIEFVPMTWGAFNLPPQTLYDKLEPLIKRKKIKRLLAFNEPDGKKQANVSVEKALELWPSLEKLNIPLGSPAPVHPDKEWLQSFMKGATEKGYRVDYICVHDYGGMNAKALLNKLERVYKLYGRPILITEFAVADWKAKTPQENKYTDEQVQQFMKEILPALDALPYVYGYSWFSFGRDSAAGTSSALFEEDGTLTKLGEIYAAHKSKK